MTGLIKLVWNQSQTCLDSQLQLILPHVNKKGTRQFISNHWKLWILFCNYTVSAETVLKWSINSVHNHLRYLQVYFSAFIQLINGRTQIQIFTAVKVTHYYLKEKQGNSHPTVNSVLLLGKWEGITLNFNVGKEHSLTLGCVVIYSELSNES